MSFSNDFTEFHHSYDNLSVDRDFRNLVLQTGRPSVSEVQLADAWATGEWPAGRMTSPDGFWDKQHETPGPVIEKAVEDYTEQPTKPFKKYNEGEVFEHPYLEGEVS